jgi:hypothetical protein
MATAKSRAFERIIDLAANDLKPPEFMKWHAQVARQVLAEHLAEMPPDTQHRTIVDGRVGADEDSVRYGGVIRYEFGAVGKVVEEALAWLRREAANASRSYSESFFVGVLRRQTQKARPGQGGKQTFQTYEAEGRLIPADSFGAASKGLPADAQFIIGNSKPFNRKVDVQLVGGQRINFNIDDQIYERCAMALRGRFPGFDLSRVYTLTFGALRGERQWILQTGPRAGRPVHSPGLVITRI